MYTPQGRGSSSRSVCHPLGLSHLKSINGDRNTAILSTSQLLVIMCIRTPAATLKPTVLDWHLSCSAWALHNPGHWCMLRTIHKLCTSILHHCYPDHNHDCNKKSSTTFMCTVLSPLHLPATTVFPCHIYAHAPVPNTRACAGCCLSLLLLLLLLLRAAGAISALQFQAVRLACARHELRLPDGSRAGFFLGDGECI